MIDTAEPAQAASTSLGFPPTTIAVFIGLAIMALALDLAAHRKDKPISLLSASLWSVFWVLISMVFAGYLYFSHGPRNRQSVYYRLRPGKSSQRRQPVCFYGNFCLV